MLYIYYIIYRIYAYVIIKDRLQQNIFLSASQIFVITNGQHISTTFWIALRPMVQL